jgi:hypothetical protein
MVLPLDMPDDYIYLPGSGKSTLGDMGELAVRIGSPVSYDRRGSVYWYDDFEDGIGGYSLDLAGTGAAIRYTHSYVFRGALSAKLTGGSTGNKHAGLIKRISPALFTTFGLEVTYSIAGNVSNIVITFRYYTGTILYEGATTIEMANQRALFTSPGPVYPPIIPLDIEINDPALFNTSKLVVDMVNLTYLRFMHNQDDFSLNDGNLVSTPQVSPARLEAIVLVNSVAGSNGIIYVDNMIVTIGDP